jgi:hypothetical protein
MEKRSRRRIRDLENLLASEGLFENESGCARISIMAKSTKALLTGRIQMCRPIPPSLTSGLQHTAGHTAHARTFVEAKLLASWCSGPFSLKVAALVKVSNSMRRSKKLERKNGYCRSPLSA